MTSLEVKTSKVHTTAVVLLGLFFVPMSLVNLVSGLRRGQSINRAAFNFPPAGQQGTLGRNALKAFSVSQVDVALARLFALTERWKVQLRAEAFNVFNLPNFAGLVTRINFPTFGRSQSNKSLGFDAGLNPLYQIGGPRSIQSALKRQL